MNSGSHRDRAAALALESKAKPIVVDDSETEDDSDDENLASMRTSTKPGTSTSRTAILDSNRKVHATVVDDSETEDESDDNESKKPASNKSSAGKSADSVPASVNSVRSKNKEQKRTPPQVQNGPLGSLPDRAQMEADRLARRKRMREDEEATGDHKRQRVAGTTLYNTPKTPLASRTFYDGAFFPTATLHANQRADGREAIGFQDIIGPATNSDLKFAILSSFGCSPEWLKSHFPPAVPVVLVVGSGTEESGPSMCNLFDNWVQTCPKLGKGGCMHMKYMVLFYKSGRVRVVISTANLIPVDWEHLENAVFIQDVALNSSSSVFGTSLTDQTKKSSSEAKPEAGFATILGSVLKATNVGPALEHLKQMKIDLPFNSIDELSKLWNWSNVTAELVPSIAGKSEGWKRIMTNGHPRLMRAIQALGLATTDTQDLVIECQGSSIGMYTTQWFNHKRKKLAYPPGVKVVFPSLATVKGTAEHGARSLFCTRKKWEGKTFPRAAFHDSNSSGGPVLMHTKMIIATFAQKRNAEQEDASSSAGWMYLGSHNFTSPAWGNLTGDASVPVLNVNNFELGVVIPLATTEDVNKASAKYNSKDLPWVREAKLFLNRPNFSTCRS
ncbi:tyrosyl-DNA phosphodiesterase-domain-containing protein [Mycena vulgaris]|nr:tyrosyl-DNA phosphodiesterase-domain-containing protein [Mycena vulgaris]